jgi:hypothetical protein
MAAAGAVLTAKDLIARHEAWKLTLWGAVFSRKPLSLEQVNQIVHAEQCPIGRWLESEASANLRDSEEYEDVVDFHADFHEEMMAVASLLASKEYDEARRAIAPGSSFAETGRQLVQAITALNRVQRIVAPE